MFIENTKGTFLCLNEKDEIEQLNKWKIYIIKKTFWEYIFKKMFS